MKTIKLAEALLRRKELSERVDRLETIKSCDYTEPRLQRTNVNEKTDEVRGYVPLFERKELVQELDWNARQLRLVDAAVQQANWTTGVEVGLEFGEAYDPDCSGHKEGAKSVKLAEALIRRKELQQKLNSLRSIDAQDLVRRFNSERIEITDSISVVTDQVETVPVCELTAEFDWYARRLRKVDGIIQQTNWVTEVEVQDSVLSEFEPKD